MVLIDKKQGISRVLIDKKQGISRVLTDKKQGISRVLIDKKQGISMVLKVQEHRINMVLKDKDQGTEWSGCTRDGRRSQSGPHTQNKSNFSRYRRWGKSGSAWVEYRT